MKIKNIWSFTTQDPLGCFFLFATGKNLQQLPLIEKYLQGTTVEESTLTLQWPAWDGNRRRLWRIDVVGIEGKLLGWIQFFSWLGLMMFFFLVEFWFLVWLDFFGRVDFLVEVDYSFFFWGGGGSLLCFCWGWFCWVASWFFFGFMFAVHSGSWRVKNTSLLLKKKEIDDWCTLVGNNHLDPQPISLKWMSGDFHRFPM